MHVWPEKASNEAVDGLMFLLTTHLDTLGLNSAEQVHGRAGRS